MTFLSPLSSSQRQMLVSCFLTTCLIFPNNPYQLFIFKTLKQACTPNNKLEIEPSVSIFCHDVVVFRDDHDKIDEQKRWLDTEIEKMVQQRREVEELHLVSIHIIRFYLQCFNIRLHLLVRNQEIRSMSDTCVAKKYFWVQNARSQILILMNVSKGYLFMKICWCENFLIIVNYVVVVDLTYLTSSTTIINFIHNS